MGELLPSGFGFLIPLALALGIFFLIRGIVLWYWKVNEIVGLLKDIKNNTSKASSQEEKSK
jgi:hypothetical protein